MRLLQHILSTDPAAPRLTVYTESTGARMEFSAQTLDNWAAKIANTLEEELELTAGDQILIDLEPSWQAAVIALGAIAARIHFTFVSGSSAVQAVFTSLDNARNLPATVPSGIDTVVVTADPFGRGVAEIGQELPSGCIDFGPTVRFYGDDYYGDAPALPDFVAAQGVAARTDRLLSLGWSGDEAFHDAVLAPLAGGGSAVIVVGLSSTDRLHLIAESEKVTARY